MIFLNRKSTLKILFLQKSADNDVSFFKMTSCSLSSMYLEPELKAVELVTVYLESILKKFFFLHSRKKKIHIFQFHTCSSLYFFSLYSELLPLNCHGLVLRGSNLGNQCQQSELELDFIRSWLQKAICCL